MDVDFRDFGCHDIAIVQTWIDSNKNLFPYLDVKLDEVNAIRVVLFCLRNHVSHIDTVDFLVAFRAFCKLVGNPAIESLHIEFHLSLISFCDVMADYRYAFIHRYDK